MFGNKDSLGSIMNCFSSWNNLNPTFLFSYSLYLNPYHGIFLTYMLTYMCIRLTILGIFLGKIKIKSTTEV